MAEDASSKKFIVSNFTNYKMTDLRRVMKQYNELLVTPSWKDFKHTLKHQKEELTLVELDSHLRIKESLRVQDNIYVAGSKNRPPKLNKDNYVPWSSRLLRYAKSKPNGKLIDNSIMHGPYVRRTILKPGDPDREVPVAETFHEQTHKELTEKEVKQMEADDQAIQIVLKGLPKDNYVVVDSYETA
ncbi:hypothetical protein Tco_0894919 [Tanacetum coccineum]|uniref:Uncharacterized protein n=1 Tax=Tanacetum coccineum TaxID=301880 RepID=A0ABQ5CEJ8_9ASTR